VLTVGVKVRVSVMMAPAIRKTISMFHLTIRKTISMFHLTLAASKEQIQTHTLSHTHRRKVSPKTQRNANPVRSQ
jgi:hypothetical protein